MRTYFFGERISRKKFQATTMHSPPTPPHRMRPRFYRDFYGRVQVGAYCYAELGCMISKSGADYAYIMETFGPFIAFMRLWVECMIVRPCSQAIVALTFSLYVLKPIYTDCDPPEESTRLLAACCIGKSYSAVKAVIKKKKMSRSKFFQPKTSTRSTFIIENLFFV